MKLKYIFLIAILLCTVLVATSAPAEVYRPIQPSDNSLSGLVSATGDVSAMDYWFEDGRLYVDSEIHGTMDFRFNVKQAGSRFKGWNGQAVRVSHKTDAGIVDTSEVVNVQSDGVWIYFYDVDFSTVIVDGYAGTYTKTDSTVYNNMTNFSYGQSLTNMSSVTVNVTQGYTSALSKYDYTASLGPVLWLKADGNANDSSVYGFNGTIFGNTNTTANGKYNESFGINGAGSYVDIGSYDKHNFSNNNFSIIFAFSTTGVSQNFVIKKEDAGNTPGFRVGVRANGRLFCQIADGISSKLTTDDGRILNDGNTHIAMVVFQSGKIYRYVDGVIDGSVDTETIGNLNTSTSLQIGQFVIGNIDNTIILDYAINETIRNNLYYDPVQELKFRTNSNSTWSDNWNSTSDNSMDVNFGSGEVLTHLIKYVPTEATVDDVITRDYNTTAQFSMSSTVGFTEPTTVISEAAASNYYTLNISHQAGLNSSGYINYTTTDATFLGAEWRNSATLYSDNQNATLTFTDPTFYISTGVLNSGDEWQYNVTAPYGDMPNYDIVFTDYDASNTDRIVNISITNITFGITKVGFNLTENTDGVTYIWYYNNGTEIMRLTSSATNDTLEFMPDVLVSEGGSYIYGQIVETFVVPAVAFVTIVFATVAATSRRVRRGFRGFINRRLRRR